MLLADGGRALARIVIDPGATQVEEFAASELQRYLGRIASGEFAVLRSAGAPEGRSIVVARADSDLGRSVTSGDEPCDPESYLIAIDDEQIRLVGADDRGVLYAVYAFLEEECGVFWLAPRVGHEVVPSLPTLEVAEGSRIEGPAWPIRMLAPLPKKRCNIEQFKHFIDFAAKIRLNSFMLFAGHFDRHVFPSGKFVGTQSAEPWDEVRDELLPEFEKRGIWLDIGHHSWNYFVSPDEYFDDHPEWFSLFDGERVATRQICLASETVHVEFERNIRAYLRGHPEIRIMSLFPNDVADPVCECEHCRPLDLEDAALTLVNRMAGSLEDEFPKVRFAHLSYRRGAGRPSRILPRSNVILYWSAWGHCQAHGYFSPECSTNSQYRASLDEWREIWPNEIIVYDYYSSTNHTTNMLIPFPNSMAEDIRGLHARGFDGCENILTQIENWWTCSLNLWLFAKLTWNPEHDPEELMGDWVKVAYPTTAPYVIPAYEGLRDVGRYEALYHRSDIGMRLLRPKGAGGIEQGSVAELDEILMTVDECQQRVYAAQAMNVQGLEAEYLRRLAVALRYSKFRFHYLRGLVSGLAELAKVERVATTPEAREDAMQAARRWLDEMDSVEAGVVSLLDELGDGVEGILHPDYVRYWAKPTVNLPQHAARTALETRIEHLDGGTAAL